MDGLDQRIAGPKAYNPKVNVMEWGCIVEKNSICKQRLSTPSNVGPDEITAAIPCKSKVLDLFRSFTLHSDKYEEARDYHPSPPPPCRHARTRQPVHTHTALQGNNSGGSCTGTPPARDRLRNRYGRIAEIPRHKHDQLANQHRVLPSEQQGWYSFFRKDNDPIPPRSGVRSPDSEGGEE